MAISLCVLAAACGGNGDDDKADDDAQPATTAAPANCPGQPLKFTTFASLTGAPTGPVDEDVSRRGIDAALSSINGKCTLGRPLEVNLCDDTFDVNGSLACGRKVATDGTLAILSSVGQFDDGANASKLPGVFLLGTSAFDLLNPEAYSSVSGVTLGMGGVSAAKSAGAKTFVLILPDVPALQFVSTQVEEIGKQLDVEVETIFIPVDTTDYAPVAAQIAQRDPDAIGLLPLAPVPVINALAAEGLTPDAKVISILSLVMTPEVVESLGDAGNGLVVIGPTMPPTEEKNEGIKEFRADLEAIGADPDDPNVSFATVLSWSNLKKLEAALLAAGPDVIASLDSKSLVDAVVAHPIDRPESAPYDFQSNQLPEFPELADFRIFTREVAFLKLDDGKFTPLADEFIDVTDPPSLK